MLKGRFSNSSLLLKTLILILLCLVFTGITLTIWLLIMGNTTDITSLKWMQMLQTLSTFLLPPIAAAYLWSEQPMQWLKTDRGVNVKTVVGIVCMMLIALPAINLLSCWNQQVQLPAFLETFERWAQSMAEAQAETMKQFIFADSIGVFAFNLFFMALLPAVAEELFFRGAIQQMLKEKTSVHIAIWVTAILFSLVHLDLYGFIPRVLLGAAFGYMVEKTGSIWSSVMAHFTNNAAIVCIYDICLLCGKNFDVFDEFGYGDTLYAGIASLLICVVVISFVILRPRKNS